VHELVLNSKYHVEWWRGDVGVVAWVRHRVGGRQIQTAQTPTQKESSKSVNNSVSCVSGQIVDSKVTGARLPTFWLRLSNANPTLA